MAGEKLRHDNCHSEQVRKETFGDNIILHDNYMFSTVKNEERLKNEDFIFRSLKIVFIILNTFVCLYY